MFENTSLNFPGSGNVSPYFVFLFHEAIKHYGVVLIKGKRFIIVLQLPRTWNSILLLFLFIYFACNTILLSHFTLNKYLLTPSLTLLILHNVRNTQVLFVFRKSHQIIDYRDILVGWEIHVKLYSNFHFSQMKLVRVFLLKYYFRLC